ncbi:unnamed protein product [Sphagnum troendelagicum]|uniref:PH domain-containing protein n=1 Tax=Sphagnum troendelagicum TaxID=128251 RepID=A0ABP0TVS9_9BRYO
MDIFIDLVVFLSCHYCQVDRDEDTKNSVEKIKQQLNRGSGRVILEGYLLKRSETLRKWNRRWFTLDPSTGKMEYRSERGDLSPRGLITFDSQSTITVSPLNLMKESKYDGCCFYIGTSQKKEFFFCAEKPAAARAWVATLRAAALVLKAHKEAVESLSGHSHAKQGDVAAVVAAANATAWEAAKDVQIPITALALASTASNHSDEVDMENVKVWIETLRVKDDEICQLSRDLKARDLTIKELAGRLSETAQAAESAASTVYVVENQRKAVLSEVDHLHNELLRVVQKVCWLIVLHSALGVSIADEHAAAALKSKETALKETHYWRLELGKAQEQNLVLETSLMRMQDCLQQLKAAHDKELTQPQAARLPLEQSLEVKALSNTAMEAPTVGLPAME